MTYYTLPPPSMNKAGNVVPHMNVGLGFVWACHARRGIPPTPINGNTFLSWSEVVAPIVNPSNASENGTTLLSAGPASTATLTCPSSERLILGFL